MIRRDAGDHFLLITQHDHALLAGQLARRIGNERFATPSAREAVIDAIAQHDCGWPLHDDAPTLNKDGLPLHVFESPVPLATRVWGASVTGAMARGDYQGLLVSLHVFGLSAIYLAHAAEPSRPDVFEMNKFQHRQIEIEDTLRQRLGLNTQAPLHLGLARPGTSPADDQLLYNFRLLTLMDRISLALCCGKDLFPTVNDVYTRPPQPGDQPVPLSLTMPNPATMQINPWPFDRPQLNMTIPARRLPRTPFPSTESFQSAYTTAPIEQLMLTVQTAS